MCMCVYVCVCMCVCMCVVCVCVIGQLNMLMTCVQTTEIMAYLSLAVSGLDLAIQAKRH